VDIYKIEPAYDESGDSPWDALWYDGDDEDLDALDCQMCLNAVWKAPVVRLEKREATPSFYVFQVYYATTKKFRDLLVELVADSVEFLPLRVSSGKRLFVMHPLLRVDLDDGATVSGKSGENITAVRKYSVTVH
jgi:hypothetical protein